MLKYINGNRKKKLVLSVENIYFIEWYVETSFSVHPYFKSHTGGVMTLGGGAIQYIYCN